MKNEKGFTLIELLAVIVILGVLLGIAIPKVSQYINKSKKDGFISSAQLNIDSVRQDATSEIYPLPINNNDVTIVTLDSIKMEKAKEKSSFGGKYLYNKSYVVIINAGTGTDPDYKYYFAAQDSKNYALPLTPEEKISADLIIAKAKNKMEVTVQPLCGTEEGYTKSYNTISGLEDVQPVDGNGNKLDWNVTIFSGKGCIANAE